MARDMSLSLFCMIVITPDQSLIHPFQGGQSMV
jgi:hypothetical protein